MMRLHVLFDSTRALPDCSAEESSSEYALLLAIMATPPPGVSLSAS
jgi:hypothetical protein